LVIVIEPGLFVILIAVPEFSAADTGAPPVDPIRSWPFVGALVVVSNPPVPLYTNEFGVKLERVKFVPVVPAGSTVKLQLAATSRALFVHVNVRLVFAGIVVIADKPPV
jgi:hypothetical protein